MKNIFTIAILAFTVNAFSQTSIPGGNVSGTWTLAGSPYLINGGILIPDGQTLTIQSGVNIQFQGNYKLLVLGRLLAMGTQNDSITFISSDTTNGWLGIEFNNTTANNDTSKIIFCKILYAKASGSVYFNNFSKAIISNCLISKNTNGSGIYCYSSGPLIKNNTISNNSTSSGGGGIRCMVNSNPNIMNNIIKNNSSGYRGGGIFFENSNSYISNITSNIISNNTSDGEGGGIYLHNCSHIITNNTISNNSTNYRGGGIFFGYCTNLNISSNIISNNSAFYDGGGIYINGGDFHHAEDTSNIISNNAITNNMAENGGGIYCSYQSPIFTNNTIAYNNSINGGAMLCTDISSPSVYNCILWGNTATTSGTQVYLGDETSDPNFYYNNIQGGSSAFGVGSNIYTGIYQNNLNTDPLFVLPTAGSGTGYNGLLADWSLQSISQCINSGNPSGTYPASDLVGNPRVYGCIIDMGALENQNTPASTVSFTTSVGSFVNINSNLVSLTGSPSGGVFSGLGVTSNSFNPTLAGLGSSIITYTLSNGAGCNGSSSQNIIVYDTTGIICTSYDTLTTEVFDTTYVTVIDTNYVTINDTVYISVTDTLIINAVLTGITPPNNVNTIKIYPNPASTHIYIDNGNYTSMNGYMIKIDNSLGQTVFTTPFTQQQYYIDLSSWTGNGTYFVYIIDNLSNTIDVRKIILQ